MMIEYRSILRVVGRLKRQGEIQKISTQVSGDHIELLLDLGNDVVVLGFSRGTKRKLHKIRVERK